MSKVKNISEVVNIVKSGMTIMIGGFMNVGVPDKIVSMLAERDVKDLTLIANDTGFPGKGIGKLIRNKQIRKVIASHIGTNPETGQQMIGKELEVELIPQGTLVERIRAGGAGLGGFLTPTGIGTTIEYGKQRIKVNGGEYLLELPLRADIAIVNGYLGDTEGNLVYRRVARNFNPVMATAADLVIAEVENLVGSGEIDPDQVMTPSIFIDSIVKGGKCNGCQGKNS